MGRGRPCQPIDPDRQPNMPRRTSAASSQGAAGAAVKTSRCSARLASAAAIVLSVQGTGAPARPRRAAAPAPPNRPAPHRMPAIDRSGGIPRVSTVQGAAAVASRDSGSDAPFERIAEASHGEESFGNARGPRTSGAPTTRRPLAGMGGQHGEGQRRRDDIRRFSPLGELSGTAPTVNRKRSGNFVTMYSVSDLVEPGPASYHREIVQSGVSKRRHIRDEPPPPQWQGSWS